MNRLRESISEKEKQRVLRLFEGYEFFHRFEIFEGVFTPGALKANTEDILNQHNLENDLTGLTTLDIGCMEGALAYEFEKRGAISYAIDIHDPDEVAFNLCRDLLNSHVIHHRETVYNVGKIFEPSAFDIIAFRGVYYHLKDPIGALEAIAPALKPGGKLLISGECLVNEMFDLDGKKYDAGAISQTELANVPLCICYPGSIKNIPSSIWFVPNLACIKSWLIGTGFELCDFTMSRYSDETISVAGIDRSLQRFSGVAVKVKNFAEPEHPVWKWKKTPAND